MLTARYTLAGITRGEGAHIVMYVCYQTRTECIKPATTDLRQVHDRTVPHFHVTVKIILGLCCVSARCRAANPVDSASNAGTCPLDLGPFVSQCTLTGPARRRLSVATTSSPLHAGLSGRLGETSVLHAPVVSLYVFAACLDFRTSSVVVYSTHSSRRQYDRRELYSQPPDP